MHYVKSLEAGSWWDSVKRKAHQVQPGSVVGFEDPQDAAYFGDGERGEPVAQKVYAAKGDWVPASKTVAVEIEVTGGGGSDGGNAAAKPKRAAKKG